MKVIVARPSSDTCSAVVNINAKLRVALHGIEAATRNRNNWLDTWDEHRIDVDEV